VQTALKVETLGDFERTDAFTSGRMVSPRERSGTSQGSFVSRMSAEDGKRGWDLYWQNAGARRANSTAKKKQEKQVAADPAAKAAAKQQAEDDDVETRPSPRVFSSQT
jgi:hypothetical protein